MFIATGTVIDGKYEIQGTIGSGGMGVVYEALQTTVDRLVALKLLTYAPSDDSEDVKRFEREARVLSRLSHPNIVHFYSYGTWQGYPYIAMERLQGDNLQQLLARNESGLDFNFALKIAIQIAGALQHAHSEGVFHRDIKPSNVILTSEAEHARQIKLVDFGMAKLTGIDGEQKLTLTGQALGSVMYMSPEQCLGHSVDGRTDVYGLGCLLYHCLTGSAPFMADNGVAMMFQHLNEPITGSLHWKRLTPPAQQVIARCLAKQAQHRYAGAAQLEADLQLLLSGAGDKIQHAPPQALTPASSGRRRKGLRTALVAAAILVALLGVAAVIYVSNSAPGTPPPVTTDGEQSNRDGAQLQESAALISSPLIAYKRGKRLLDNGKLTAAESLLWRANELLALEQTKSAPAGKADARTVFQIESALTECLQKEGKYDQAYPMAVQAAEGAKQLSKSDQGSALMRLSAVLSSLQRHDQALAVSKRAVAAYDGALADFGRGATSHSQRACAGAWGNLANCYLRVEQYKDAEVAARKSVFYAKEQPYDDAELQALRLLASTQFIQKEYQQALHTMKEWLSIEAAPDEHGAGKNTIVNLSEGHEFLGKLYQAMGDDNSARKNYAEAINQAGQVDKDARDLILGQRYNAQAQYFYRCNQIEEGDKSWATAEVHLKRAGERAALERNSPAVQEERNLALQRLSNKATPNQR